LAAVEPHNGAAAMLEDCREFFTASPDSYATPINLFEGDEWAMLEWQGGATWRDTFAGEQTYGRSFTLRGCGFFHVVNGTIKLRRGCWDRATWFGQFGVDCNARQPCR
jgi:hypothetical protein